MSARILVIEDDPAISFGLRTNLSFEGYTVEVAETRAAAGERVRGAGPSAPLPDLVVLDLMLPDGTGFEVMDDLRQAGFEGRVLVLSARKEETDKVGALRMGADDYVTKPFSLAELLARVEALLRRSKAVMGNGHPAVQHPSPLPAPPVSAPSPPPEAQRIRFGRCEIDLYSRTLRVDLEPVELTRLEFDLLLYLAQHPGQALSRGQLLREVWGLQHEGSARTVDNVIAHLRTKIGEDADRPRHLRTLRGAGYRFELEPDPEADRKR